MHNVYYTTCWLTKTSVAHGLYRNKILHGAEPLQFPLKLFRSTGCAPQASKVFNHRAHFSKIAWHVHCSLTLTSPQLFGLDALAWPAAMNELCHLLFVCERALVWVMATATHQLFSLAPAANARVRLTSHMTNQLNSKWGIHPQGHLRHVQAFSLSSFPTRTKILWHMERWNS